MSDISIRWWFAVLKGKDGKIQVNETQSFYSRADSS